MIPNSAASPTPAPIPAFAPVDRLPAELDAEVESTFPPVPTDGAADGLDVVLVEGKETTLLDATAVPTLPFFFQHPYIPSCMHSPDNAARNSDDNIAALTLLLAVV